MPKYKMPEITNKLNNQNSHVIIAQDVNSDGAKRFLGFRSYLQLFPYIEEQEEKCFHEVMVGLQNRKLYFDMDKKKEQGDFPDVVDFVNDISEIIIGAVDTLFNKKVSDICFTDSCTDDKFSMHIIVPKFNTSVVNMRLLYKVVAHTLNLNPIYKDCLDPSIYKTNQTLRMLHCRKMGKDNTKKLYTSSFTELDTLIGYLHDTEEITLRPEIQKKIDQHNQEREGRILNHVAKSPEIFRAIIMGMNASRADDFECWRNVCLALGYEGSGVDICLDFARRSNKFNEPATRRLYDSGPQYALTIGTLLSYLKHDNPALFGEIVNFEEKEDMSDIIEQLKRNEDEDSEDDEAEVVKEKTEEKMARWLGNPSFYLQRLVSDGKSVLGEDDRLIEYAERYMKAYKKHKTQVVKAEKGQGKTYQIEKYIKKNKPAKCIYLSFRRSFSKEILKRLGKLGFVDYREIDGPITDAYDRIILQVESLHRLRWTEKCDLLVPDEIESIRTQFFSPTCKVRTAVIEKYEMLMRTSDTVIAMDADISRNTVEHIKSIRGEICYVQNLYTEVQAKFKEYYTSNEDVWMGRLGEALSAGHRVAVPTNRSVEFMEGLKNTISKKFPKVKLQLYNSKTIRNEEVAEELNDVDKSWAKYDVIIYSPTISAGVSFDKAHFDKCFCYFTNNGKINSMRQMISRIRNFSTNEFYYCLKPYGGTGKPTTIAEYEKYICSNRFIGDKPQLVLSRENYDGTREYPYKTMGYYLWIYNETERNRDKNMFIYNFMREQHNAGIGSMEMMTAVEEPNMNKEEVKNDVSIIKAKERVMIANADPLDDKQKEDIQKRLEKEENVSDDERYRLKRRNLIDCYDLGERVICTLFVENYDKAAMKKAYHNRKALREKGVEGMMKEESASFNGIFLDHVSIQDDLKKEYKSLKILIAKELVEIAGFSGFYDEEKITKANMLANFKAKEDVLCERMSDMCDIMGKAKRRRPNIRLFKENTYLQSMLKFVNSILMELLQLKIGLESKNSDLYMIFGINQFNFGEDSFYFRGTADI